MNTEILMPQLGETVTEGTIINWFKAVGDAISPGDNLFEIETDKTTMEVPATAAGVLSEIRVDAGATVEVGSVVAVLSVQEATQMPTGSRVSTPGAPTVPLDPFQAVHTPERNFGPAKLPSGVEVTPIARRLAAEDGIDLHTIAGSGAQGRIVAKDVRHVSPAAPAPAKFDVQAAPDDQMAEQMKKVFAGVPFEEVLLDKMRRTIAGRLLKAKQTIPHFYLTADVALDRLIDVRTELNAGGSLKLSVNDFVIKALALAMQQVPDANAIWAGDRILRFKQSDVGVAVSVAGGLFTPVIRQAETKSISAISREMKVLAGRARGKGLNPAEYEGGSIAISNLGMYGVRSFAAIVNPPQAAILAVGAAARRPMERTDGSVYFGSVLTVTLSCDHRVIDGVLGAQLLAAFKALMETPLSLLALTSE